MRPTSHESRKERGFTLVELIVVIGILAVLAAVVVPAVAQFTSKGNEAAETTERDAVQSSLDLFMAEQGMSTITIPSEAISDFSASSTPAHEAELYPGYLRQNPVSTDVNCEYTWDEDGIISQTCS